MNTIAIGYVGFLEVTYLIKVYLIDNPFEKTRKKCMDI